MAQRVKVLVTKPADLSVIPGAHVAEGRESCPLTFTHITPHTCRRTRSIITLQQFSLLRVLHCCLALKPPNERNSRVLFLAASLHHWLTGININGSSYHGEKNSVGTTVPLTGQVLFKCLLMVCLLSCLSDCIGSGSSPCSKTYKSKKSRDH